METCDIVTEDGVCRARLHTPPGAGPWPAVLMYMDGLGIRPAMQAVAQRLAASGYLVLLPDLFYRSGPYDPIVPKTLFDDPSRLRSHRERFMAPATPERVMADTEACLRRLAADPRAAAGKPSLVGYCMGGRMAVMAAATFGDRIALAAAFHPGGLVTDAPSSPHLQAALIRARIYVGGAAEDAHFTNEMKARLERALAAAGVEYQIETYPARHGWVFDDMPAYDAAAAERHWTTLTSLLADAYLA